MTKNNKKTFRNKFCGLINKIIDKKPELDFKKISAEQNNADMLLYVNGKPEKKILFGLKNSIFDATNEVFVKQTSQKAKKKACKYFVIVAVRQLAVYKVFEADTLLADRKFKIYTSPNETQITVLLNDLLKLLQADKTFYWDSFEQFFEQKLTSFILQASAKMHQLIFKKINENSELRKKIKTYLQEQEIFELNLSFDYQNVYNITQLANYLFYLKIIFYTQIRKELPNFNLKPILVSSNKNLHSQFNELAKFGYEKVFKKTVFNEFEFEKTFLPQLQEQINELQNIDLKQIKSDVIGSVYNTLIKNNEQQQSGQHFTNTHEVDIVNAFCINKNTKIIIDTACGAGSFLVRAYHFLKYFHPKISNKNLLERIWGIEIAKFPVFLSSINLSLLNVKHNNINPQIIHSNFSDIIKNNNTDNNLNISNINKAGVNVSLPEFDACIGNPPYIRQELIENKKTWISLVQNEWNIKKINRQSDLYVFYLNHTAAFLKNGKRLGYVISASWLDVSYGEDFQKFMLDNFKIIAIIDNQKLRSFETASINTVILIIEKCSNKKERAKNNVKFVRLYSGYENLIGKNNDDTKQIEKLLKFTQLIENTVKTTKNKHYYTIVKNQELLENETSIKGKYQNGHWGAKYLRAPEIFNKITNIAKNKLVALSEIAEVKRGFTTGANDFFYVTDHTYKALAMPEQEYLTCFGEKKEKHKQIWENTGWFYSKMTQSYYLLNRMYLKPLFKTQREAMKLDVSLKSLKNRVIICSKNRQQLAKQKSNLLNYITKAEIIGIHKRSSLASRKIWYNLKSAAFVGNFIFPSKIGEKYRLIDNRKAKVYCDKVNYAIKLREEFWQYSDIIFLILNSQIFRYFIDLFARQLTGSQTISDVDVNVLERTLIIRPELLISKKAELQEIYKSLKSREQGTIFEEIKQADKQKLDTIIMEVLGLGKNDAQELYKVAAKYVQDRKEKSETLKTKTKKTKNVYFMNTH